MESNYIVNTMGSYMFCHIVYDDVKDVVQNVAEKFACNNSVFIVFAPDVLC